MKLEQNMGKTDRIVRSILAAAMVTAYATGKIKGTTGKLLLGLAAIFLTTSAVGHCPAYSLAGTDTLKKDEIVLADKFQPDEF